MEPTRLKLGKGAAFVKAQLRRLRQNDATWQADFRALPKSRVQPETHDVGIVVTDPDRLLVAYLNAEGTPTVNELATLLAHAMKRPLTGNCRRPRRIAFRRNPRWRELFPHLEDLGIEVVVRDDLPLIEEECDDYLRFLREGSKEEPHSASDQTAVAAEFPAIARWVRGYGHIEIGDQAGFGMIVRAIDDGGVVFEDSRPHTLAEAMAVLEVGLVRWFESYDAGTVAKTTGSATRKR